MALVALTDLSIHCVDVTEEESAPFKLRVSPLVIAGALVSFPFESVVLAEAVVAVVDSIDLVLVGEFPP
ncbi:unannotated protein [freshwater metagenome]|uniref:Unannotated protein n=1 Tax=freshwater metagenome TaxID=449393 RepID=A0A6J5ZH10_9ZZZZ